MRRNSVAGRMRASRRSNQGIELSADFLRRSTTSSPAGPERVTRTDAKVARVFPGGVERPPAAAMTNAAIAKTARNTTKTISNIRLLSRRLTHFHDAIEQIIRQVHARN